MKKIFVRGIIAAGLTVAGLNAATIAQLQFEPNTLVLTRSSYKGTADTVTIGETLPPGCPAGPNGMYTVAVPTTTGGTTDVTVTCGVASDNGEYPNLNDSHNVWNNANSDGSFGITSPIYLDNLSLTGNFIGETAIPTSVMVTSFSSKSELAINLSGDEQSLTFMGYQGGQGCGADGATLSPTAANLIDVSASNTPGVCDPTNPVISSSTASPTVPTAYYRAVAEVDAFGNLTVTPGNAYSGDNGRAAIKGENEMYYMVGNDNSGNLSKKQMTTTQDGINLANATGAETLTPGQTPPVPPNIEMIGRLLFSGDKPGKDTNFRGMTIFGNTLYVSKGSGGNGINTVYQVGTKGTLPTGTAAQLANVPITILPGFPTSGTSTAFPFGMWFANDHTLYVCDEGDGTYVPGGANVADAQSLATAGLQKWVLEQGTWVRVYIVNNGLNIGVPYSIANYPASLNPATGGCRNITGQNDPNGVATIWAITSTISQNGDTGADPNQLVMVRDTVNALTLPAVQTPSLDTFITIRSAVAGEVFRGIALSPGSKY